MITRAAILSVLLCAVSTTQGMLYETILLIYYMYLYACLCVWSMCGIRPVVVFVVLVVIIQ